MSAAAGAPALSERTQALLHAPLMATLLRLAAPNVLGLSATTVVIAYDGFILGRIGADALAGVALVFPLLMLMMQMSGGGLGGAVTAAVARALGAGRTDDARQLARHALVIGTALGGVFMLLLLPFGRLAFVAMGGRGAALQAALAYSDVLFGGAVVLCLTNVLAAAVRGAGNMGLPAALLMLAALLHLGLSPLLVFGAGPWPGLGVAGVAASAVVTNGIAAAVLLAHLLRGGSGGSGGGAGGVGLRGPAWRLRTDMLRAILRTGAPASLSPILSNGSIAMATVYIGSYGTAALAGFGAAARLEFVMVPIAFGFGTALTTLVATNLGAGQHERALRATWTGAAVVFAITGSIGAAVAINPALWMSLFSRDAAVLAFGTAYLHIVGVSYGFFGLGLALFFASQGAGRLFWPLVASLSRLVTVALGGWLVLHGLHAPPSALFGVIATGFAIYAVTIALAIRLGRWQG